MKKHLEDTKKAAADFKADYGFAPNYVELGNYMGISSKTIRSRVVGMCMDGVVTRDSGGRVHVENMSSPVNWLTVSLVG